ncbi:Major facilitator superfamily domain, general substrate transporter [Penicillium expansum]|uniref:Major facilitator superfamily domain, general substrate transporter n=1 Tax=Penicillium expansum TaxID=27334 RepID=A0A0A2JZT7_PENEN|nr:Major facilitator superfamily domain, general substrate transporter [Penicillium expansum]KGO38946.1 Major facilitator superfamily domain, general substrate transporter [Penicillium expansum]KGO60992.1 Major facilitator superfamily domain, general substrate transporter [Penicillium expansum]KGO62186.1 Major facilitator superfamily domain, general substrate transporter [Penicillium expansum]
MFRSKNEKPSSIENVEDINQPASNNVDWDEEYSPPEQRKIIHRIDRRLILMSGLAYCISMIDRTNLGMAAVAGMTDDLGLAGTRYGMGFSKNWKHMVMTRALLGALEAGYFPGCVYLLSSWYVRYDVQKRFSIFYLFGCVASALAGVLAYGLSQMDGIQGIQGWRWIFIMEGVLSCVVGVLTLFFLVDFPDRAYKSWRFLSEKECAFIVRRINRDRADGDAEPFSMKRFLAPSLDLKIWGFAMIFFCITTNTYAISYFLPIILRQGMGYGVAASQCLVAPPFGLAAILMLITSWLGDKYRMRGPILAFNALIGIIGLPIMGFAENNAVRYFGVFLAVAGSNANVPASMAYQANNIRGQWTRALSSATLVGFGRIGGIVSSLVFREQDAPIYRLGMWTTIVSVFFSLGALTIWFRYSNKQADDGKKIIESSPDFRYTI